jgi:hypothetical protein
MTLDKYIVIFVYRTVTVSISKQISRSGNCKNVFYSNRQATFVSSLFYSLKITTQTYKLRSVHRIYV